MAASGLKVQPAGRTAVSTQGEKLRVPIARSLSEITTFTLNLLPKPMISDQMVSVTNLAIGAPQKKDRMCLLNLCIGVKILLSVSTILTLTVPCENHLSFMV